MKLVRFIHFALSFIFFFSTINNLHAQLIFADNFTTQEYNRNDGTGDWNTDWIELNDNNSPTSGDIFIFIGNAGIGPNNLAFVGDPGEGIQRAVDLSGATSASLTFDWLTNNLGFFLMEIQLKSLKFLYQIIMAPLLAS
ncbi:hypothetical protein [Aquimarina agarivorans]|uniref:hypothetical protein n=1 Tax=Aquimarina agarivorans TaxID=980584 RepID=UPI00058EC6A8|nr:hypothetical protein [Aquimarina agarivorans]